MITMQDIDLIEGNTTCTQREYYQSIQRAINSGSAWSLQGSYGRAMMEAIESGACMLGTSRARDYYGSTIPSRDDVQEGTKGSRQYVVDAMGEDWAALMEGV
jgi:hypothetical protein